MGYEMLCMDSSIRYTTLLWATKIYFQGYISSTADVNYSYESLIPLVTPELVIVAMDCYLRNDAHTFSSWCLQDSWYLEVDNRKNLTRHII